MEKDERYCSNFRCLEEIKIDKKLDRLIPNDKLIMMKNKNKVGVEALNKLVDMEVNDKNVIFKISEEKYNEIINTGYRFEIRKTIQALDKVDMAIREKRFPILYVTKEQTAVIISVEEYKRLKELDNEKRPKE